MSNTPTTPQELANSLPENPTPADFVALGQKLVGQQPSIYELADRAAAAQAGESK